MLRVLFFAFAVSVALLAQAGDTTIVWRDSSINLSVEVWPDEHYAATYIYKVSFTERGVAKQFKDTVELLQDMIPDSTHLYLRQLDGKGLPELVFRGQYKAAVSAAQLRSQVSQSVFIIWDLQRRREIFRCIPFYGYQVYQTVYDADGRPKMLYGECLQQYDVTINDKNQVILRGMKDKSTGPGIESYICDPLRIVMGVYQLNDKNQYEWLKAK